MRRSGPAGTGWWILYRLFQQLRECLAGDLARAERGEVARGLLAVDHAAAVPVQALDQLHQRHLGGIRGAREHRLAEEHLAKRDTVEPALEVPVEPRLDAVRAAQLVQADLT